MLSPPHSKNVFPDVQIPCQVFSLCLLTLALSSGTTQRSLALSPLHLPFRYLYEPSLLQAKQSQFSQPFLTEEMLQSFYHFHDPSLDSLQHVHVSLVLGSPELDTGVASAVLNRGKGSPSLACWKHSSWCSPGYHLSFLQGTLLAHALSSVEKYSQLGYRHNHFFLKALNPRINLFRYFLLSRKH